MAVTLTASFRDTLKPDTIELIDNLIEDNFELSDMLTFIDENSEDDFVSFYETYVEQGEDVGYDVVDAFIGHHGISYVEHAQDAFVGVYHSEESFAEEYLDEMGHDIPCYLVIDWQATWDQSLRYDFDFVDGYVFRSSF